MEPISQTIFEASAFFIFGLLFGSFSTMASYRLPREEDLIFKRSYCPKCNHKLSIKDLFPLFSWIFSGGKCRYCKTPIHFRYPLTELSLGLLFLLVYFKLGISLQAFTMCALCVCLVIMIVTDFEHKIIPDLIQIALIPIGILYCYSIKTDISTPIYGFLFGLILSLSLRYGFYLWKKREGLGMGDVKFFAVAGIFLGVKLFPPFLMFAGVFGIITSIFWRLAGKGEEFPFGPALALSMIFIIIYPEYSVDIVYAISKR